MAQFHIFVCVAGGRETVAGVMLGVNDTFLDAKLFNSEREKGNILI